MAIGAVVLIVALAAAGAGVMLYLNRDRETVDDRYLAALDKAGLTGEFNSRANAIAQGKQTCRALDEGAPQQGLPAAEVAVQYFCPQFQEGFHVLETAIINGSMTLKDDNPSSYYPSVELTGSNCVGAGGFSDISPGTQVTVKNGKGEILATTALEPGEGGRYECVLPFSFEVTEGEDRYVVSVGRRGEVSFSFEDLKHKGALLVLGG
jgi:hypothetical protein